MRNGIIMLISVCFALCLYPSLGEAQHHEQRVRKQVRHQKKLHHERQIRNQQDALPMLESLKGDLAVTESQKSDLKNLKYEFKKAQIDHQADIKKAKLELGHLKRDETASKEAVMSAIDRVANAKAEMQKLQYSHKHEMLSVFSDEQLQELKELRRKENSESREMHHKKNWRSNKKRMRRSGGHSGI